MQLIMNCSKCWSALFKVVGVSLSTTNLELEEHLFNIISPIEQPSIYTIHAVYCELLF